MHPSEATAWARGVTSSEVRAVRDEADFARDHWSHRIGTPNELHDVSCWALGGWFAPGGALAAVAEVTVELAIILSIFPEEPRHVLRPSWE
jgi:hypothetical protein